MSIYRDAAEIAELFRRLTACEEVAFGKIVDHLRARLRAIARCRLRHLPELRPLYDEEDALQSGVFQMWEGISAGKQAPPDGVDNFLRLARTIIARWIMARARAERAGKRDPTPNEEPAWSTGPPGRYVPDDLNVLECGRTGPEVATIASDEVQWLMSLLGPALRNIADLRFLGASVAEIAAIRGTSRRTIERLLQDIRRIWSDALLDRDS